MMLFWFIVSCLLLMIFVIMIIFWSSLSEFLPASLLLFLSSSKTQNKSSEPDLKNNQLMAINVANFQYRIAELEQDFSENSISQSQFNSQKTELQRQLIQAETPEQNLKYSSHDSKLQLDTQSNFQLRHQLSAVTKSSCFLCVMVLTVLAYFLVESRDTTHQHWINQQKYAQVADALLTGKLNMPPDWSIESPLARHFLLTAMKANLHEHTNSTNPKVQQQNSQRWLRMSQLLLTMKQTDGALIALERAVKLEPDYTSSNYAKLATSYAKTGYFANGEIIPVKAEKILNTLIKHQPEHKGAVILLVMNETRKGNHEKALVLVENLRKNIEKGVHSAQKDQTLSSLSTLINSIKNNQKTITN